MSTIPPAMRAWVFNKAGTPENVLKFNPAHPTPAPPSGSNVLVRIYYAALSSAGTNLMNDVPSILRRSAIPELDFSGFIAQAGDKAPPELSPGTAVFGTVPVLSSVLGGVGNLAGYISLPAENVIVKPKTVGLPEAAGLYDLFEHSPRYLKPDGVYVNVGGVGISTALSLWWWFKNSARPGLPGGIPRKFIMFNTVPTKQRGEKIAALAAEKSIDILVDSTFKLEDALLGYKRMLDGKRNGRCLIEISS